MVLSRDDSPVEGGGNLTPTSVPDIARSLRLARERAELTVAEAAARAGLGNAVVEDLESGNVVQQQDRIATLRSLRSYADSLGLPGSDYVLVAVEQWPSIAPVLSTGHETAVVPVVSSGGVRERRGGSGSRSGKGWAVSISTLVGMDVLPSRRSRDRGASRLQKGGSAPAGSGHLPYGVLGRTSWALPGWPLLS
jgi:Helix-turn-helix domain